MKLAIALSSTVLAAAAALAALPVQAQVFSAALSGANERPTPVVSPGSGTATVTLDMAASTLRVQTSFSDLSSLTTAAHIHCCTPMPDSMNVGIATAPPAFPGFPLGVTSGSYDQTLDLLAASTYSPAFIMANGGTSASAFAALSNGLTSGQSYFNLHTAQFPAGELRGTLVAAIPEPETYALLLAGLTLLAGVARRRKARWSAA